MNKRPWYALVGLCLVAALAVLCVTADLSPAVPIAGLIGLQAANTTVLHDTLDCQGKGSWANIQIGFTTVLLNHLWPRDHHAGAWVNLFIAAPSRSASRDAGHERAHWGIWLSKRMGGFGYSWRGDRSCPWIPPEQQHA